MHTYTHMYKHAQTYTNMYTHIQTYTNNRMSSIHPTAHFRTLEKERWKKGSAETTKVSFQLREAHTPTLQST